MSRFIWKNNIIFKWNVFHLHFKEVAVIIIKHYTQKIFLNFYTKYRKIKKKFKLFMYIIKYILIHWRGKMDTTQFCIVYFIPLSICIAGPQIFIIALVKVFLVPTINCIQKCFYGVYCVWASSFFFVRLYIATWFAQCLYVYLHLFIFFIFKEDECIFVWYACTYVIIRLYAARAHSLSLI